MPGLLEGKLGLIAGLSNKYSIAWGIAEACLREGARLAYTHQARYAEQAADLVAGQPGAVLLPLEDAADSALVDPVFERIEAELGGLDFLVHSMAYAPPTAFTNRFTDTTLEDFHVAMDSSAYSLLALTRAAEPLFRKRGGGSVTAMTYLGGEKVVLGYRIVGVAKATLDSIGRYLAAELGPDNIRVNLLSLGPLRTMSARGIPGFMGMKKLSAQVAPLRRDVDVEDAGNAVVFLSSDMGRNITGETLHIDSGYNVLGFWDPTEVMGQAGGAPQPPPDSPGAPDTSGGAGPAGG
ncbi:MAG TPA: SDR family oxidoreductase [Chloroflexota bacterium]|jgi:enoyl-[acyl-carrier protein] reductase I|nr:SDR family oxidoreductase [Chloroflexota bacterium]